LTICQNDVDYFIHGR